MQIMRIGIKLIRVFSTAVKYSGFSVGCSVVVCSVDGLVCSADEVEKLLTSDVMLDVVLAMAIGIDDRSDGYLAAGNIRQSNTPDRKVK